MNDQESSISPSGILLPILLIAVSLLLFFTWQISIYSKERSEVIASRDQLEEAYKNSAPDTEKAVKQSEAVQAKLLQIATGLYDLAQSGDADAQAIVQKHQINRPTASGTSGN